MRNSTAIIAARSESKLVRAKENSPRRKPWGYRELCQAPERGERSLPCPLLLGALIAALLLPALASAAMLPDAIGAYRKTSSKPTTISDRPVWDEYGLKASETAVFEGDGKRFTATVWQLLDSTSAMAAFDWLRDAQAKPSAADTLAAETPDSLLVAHGNYLLSFKGYLPAKPDLDAVIGGLLNVDGTGLPTLLGYLPSGNLVPNSERYITGPQSLQKFDPGIPPSVAAFHMGAEALLGVFQSPKGPITLAIFNYPTNQMAMQRIAEFQKLPGAVAKRTGPMVAVTLAPPDPDAAERLLAQVRWEAVVTTDEYVPSRRDNIGNLVINAFILIAILAVFCIVSGLAVGGFWAARRHGKHGEDAAGMIVLNLEGR